MVEIPSSARVVIIGGGAVGASCLYHLARAGWADCVLLERNELTSGSTWHAAGNVPTFSASWSVMNMQRYSAELYRGLADAVDYPMNYHVTGSIRLAHSKERMQEFERVKGMGRYQGMDIEVCGPNELKNHYEYLELHDLEGGLFDPYDGDIDPAQLTQALAKGARDLGAKVIRFCAVTGAKRKNHEWIIETEKGDIGCEYVVNAAGYRAQEIGRMFGHFIPMVSMSHQYILFDEVPELRERSQRLGHKLPLLRDVDSSYYLRQEKNGFNLGPYERNCRAHWVTPDDPMPEDFSFQLYPDDLDRLEWYLEDAIARVPLMGEAGVYKVINGPIPYLPDGNPNIGPMPGVPNVFEASVFTFGICQAGGAGKVLAEWVIEGATEWDMWSCDPRRWTGWCDQEYATAKGKEIYGHEYAMHFPHHAWPAGRNKRLSPIHEKIVAGGGQMGAFNGWERALWFAKQGDDISHESTQTWARSGPWEKRVREECEAVRDQCGVLDLPGFTRLNLAGVGAAQWLRGMIAGGLPKVGRMNLGYFADHKGRIVTEMSILRHDEDVFTLITAATAEWHDREWLERSLPDGLTLSDHTEEYGTLIVSGPNSRELLAGIAEADFTLPWLSHQKATVAGRPAMLARVSFAGELGWEIHAANTEMPAIYDSVIAAGAKPFGMFALDSLRIEKGYRTWKGDLSTDYTLLEGALDRFIKFDKPQDFVGKEALLKQKQRGVKKRLVTMIVDAEDCDAPYMSTVWRDDEVVGETTSGNWGYRVGASIALGTVRADCTEPGTKLAIEIFGKRCRAVVQPEQPLWDPDNERLKT